MKFRNLGTPYLFRKCARLESRDLFHKFFPIILLGLSLPKTVFGDEISPSDIQRKRADSIVEQLADEEKFNGTVLVFDRTKILFEKSVGSLDQSRKTPVSANSTFKIGSITKQFTAYLILDAVQRGELRLETSLSELLPAKGELAKIKIKSLLNHSSGLSKQSVYFNYKTNPCHLATDTQLKPWLATMRIEQERTGKFAYSNAGYVLLACALERKTKMRYNELLRKRIFSPLKMSNSGVAWEKFRFEQLTDGISKKNTSVHFEASPFVGAGDIVSTAVDMMKWQRSLVQEGSPPATIYEEMLRCEKNKMGHGERYACGVIEDSIGGKPFYWINGNIPGYTSELSWYPSQSVGVIILSNRENFPVRQAGKTPISVSLTKIFLDESKSSTSLDFIEK